tara:strand:- start:706 stop:879 length:174 start_codon:yes stop_codon:yes gene_type:complete
MNTRIAKEIEKNGIKLGFAAGFFCAMSFCAIVLIISVYMEWKITTTPLIADFITMVQ